MEALTAVAVACLTVYDMVKAIDRGMIIEDVRLVSKIRWNAGRLAPVRGLIGTATHKERGWRCGEDPSITANRSR